MSTSMPLHQAVGQLICPTLFHGRDRHAYDPARALEALDQYGWGGYILFGDDREAVPQRLAPLQAHAPVPLLVAADMEHGAGQQVKGLSVFPPLMAFGAADQVRYAYELGAWTAREALSVGVNWIFGPVADVTNNPQNPIINIRSFGGDPARVAMLVDAFVRGCQDHGALACAKHFPGHGDTETDSHTRLGVVAASRERLEAVEFPPFQAAVKAGVASIMTAHLAVPALDDPGVPATLSRPIITGILREQWGYDGLVVTDALVMGGITETLDPLEAAVRATAAGCDMLLMPPDAVATHGAVLRAVEEGRLSEARVREALGRVLAAKARVGLRGEAPGGSPDELARRVAREALTLARGEAGLRVPDGALAIAVDDGVELDRLDAWHQALREQGLKPGRTVSVETTEEEWSGVLAEAERAEMVVLGVFSPIRIHKDRSLLPARMLDPLQALSARKRTVVVSFSSPFLVSQFPQASAWVLAYGARPVQIEAAVTALRDGQGFTGRLPVTLPDHLAGATHGRQGPEDRNPSFA
jgi:beta-N-acetylhexosaminidase